MNAAQTPEPAAAKPGRNRAAATALFVAVVGGVVATFIVLGSGDGPPRMPAQGGHHRLRFDTNITLIGTEADPKVDPLTAAQAADPARANASCISCHGAATGPRPAACPAYGPPCLVAEHPKEDGCLQCHQMAPLKATEHRINGTCQGCHGATTLPLDSHPCRTSGAPCVSAHHPPKAECIKCHRMGG